jgi:dolichyl-phosphate-mannose-protein mannosyltransferase
MASGNDRATVVSGADVGDTTRRRNIPGTPQQVLVQQPQPDDKRKAKKVGGLPVTCACET